MKNGHTTRQKAPAGRYALLDELRGLDLVSMMLYHACWDMMFLFGIWMGLVRGNAGASVAADHLLGVHSAVRLLCALWAAYAAARCYRVCRRSAGNGGDAGVHAGRPGHFWRADLSGYGYAADRCAGTAAEKSDARCGPCGVGGAVCGVLPGRLGLAVGLGWLGSHAAAEPVCDNYFTAFFPAFTRTAFYSADYFGLPPWLFLFWRGGHLDTRRWAAGAWATAAPPGRAGLALGWMGRHSLLLYLLHQPVIYGVLSARGSSFCIKGLTDSLGSCGILSRLEDTNQMGVRLRGWTHFHGT